MIIEPYIVEEVNHWRKKMNEKPSIANRIAKRMQNKLNTYLPEKVHRVITSAIKQMVKAVLFGARYTTPKPFNSTNLQLIETRVKDRIDIYKKTAAAEGGITGAGGLLSGLADFPLLMGIKIKMLYDIASLYGFNVKDYKERLYILHIFQITFSSQQGRNNVFAEMVDWDKKSVLLPEDINSFNWRIFQQEYRDYIDLAKMAQLIPVIGAPVGFIANYRLVKKLGYTAMNAYRLRLIEKEKEAGKIEVGV